MSEKNEAELVSSYYDYENSVNDFLELEELFKANVEARKAMFQINERLNIAERKALEAELAYGKRKEEVTQKAYELPHLKTVAQKESYAKLECFDEYVEMMTCKQAVSELTRLLGCMKYELQSQANHSSNLRHMQKI